MDMTYVTVPISDGEKKRLYRENKLKYVLSNTKKSKNVLVYVVEDTMDCFQLAVSADFEEETQLDEITVSSPRLPNNIWKLFFDGAYTKEGVGAVVVLIPPQGERITISHKLQFETTNNVAEYEALILGLEIARKIGVRSISVFRDSELTVQQVRQ